MGRKAQLALAVFGAPFVAASVALFLGQATFAQWSTFVSVQAPLVLGMYTGANITQKALVSKDKPGAE